ncbi:hypothetical protein LOK49_LG03G00714 [Camellia lanceoleosa]|uniref:Uncharacterized protein n=1 Tax=Camellia lanceoleosa TaxID=1840588 RepID=A0ACC0I5G6_9ERIC|nr:hypothetical protein LOK49_LG03G00714 [Camellia lanceoleosa]
MMKERGKSLDTHNFSDFNYSSASDFPCKKHPSSSSIGICPHCLKDRLVRLVCSDCGEQRLSSCSCSEPSSYRNSSAAAEPGSVGRISFLIENERTETEHSLKRSSSSCVGIKKKRNSGLWRMVRLFRKKREKGNGERSDEKSEMWVFDYMGVSRSRSLCSFRGGNFHDPDDQSSEFAFSSAKVSDFNGGPVMGSERVSGFSETESRKSGAKKGFFPVKESDFSGVDESGFIDLKLDLSSESKTDYSVMRTSTDLPVSVSDLGSVRSGNFMGHHECGNSCRITVNDTGIKKDKRGHKVWRWIFRHHPNWRNSSNKKDENQEIKPW